MYIQNFDITVNPTKDVPIFQYYVDKPKWLKYKWSWRINQLSRPKYYTEPYSYDPASEIICQFDWPELDAEIQFYADQLARPFIGPLKHTKKFYAGILPQKWHQKMSKIIDYSWKSIYNHYKYQIEKKFLKEMLKLKQTKGKKKDPKVIQKKCEEREERLNKLAKPKELKKPPKPEQEKPKIPLCDMYKDMELLALPRPYKPQDIKYLAYVPEAAMKFELTERLKELAKAKLYVDESGPPLVPGRVIKYATIRPLSDRVLKLSTPVRIRPKKEAAAKTEEEPTISPAALKYKITERTKNLSKPKEEQGVKYEKWGVKPSSLKYEPTPRILELSKPVRITPKFVSKDQKPSATS